MDHKKTEDGKVFCSKCGTDVVPKDGKCPACGSDLSGVQK